MEVKMIKNKLAAPDGFHAVNLLSGNIYDLPEEMAQAFIDSEIAIINDDKNIFNQEIEKKIINPEIKEKRKYNKK